MARYVFVVMTNSVSGKDDVFNDWYTNQHLADVVRLSPYVSAQRFRLASTTPEQSAPHRYLALYEVETDDLDATRQLLASVVRTDAMPWSEGIDDATIKGWYYEPITDVVRQS